MVDDLNKKQLLEGYVGVKFHAVQNATQPPHSVTELFTIFKRTCDRLKAYNMTPANGGNISLIHEDGFVISAAGSNLGSIERNELIFVIRCDLEAGSVFYQGELKPSSETLMHWLIYQHRESARAIIHAHDAMATRPELLVGEFAETECEEPYGTVALARKALDTFKGGKRIIVLKNHGYVAIGSDLDNACDLVIKSHKHLLAKANTRDTHI